MTTPWLDLDRESLLVHVLAETPLDALERALEKKGLTLSAGEEAKGMTVGSWLERGAPGARAPWADPADHLVAGYTCSFGRLRVETRPAPRRATGPDTFALVFGHDGRFGKLESAWVRVHVAGARKPDAARFDRRDPAWTEDEARLALAIARALEQP